MWIKIAHCKALKYKNEKKYCGKVLPCCRKLQKIIKNAIDNYRQRLYNENTNYTER